MSTTLARIACCLLVVLAPLAQPSPASASDGLVLSSHTRYEVRPADRAILVSVDVAATNVVPDTATGRTYFTGLTIPIPAEATNVSAFGGGVPLRVAVSGADELTSMADVDFSVGVFYQQTYRFRLSFTTRTAEARQTVKRGSGRASSRSRSGRSRRTGARASRSCCPRATPHRTISAASTSSRRHRPHGWSRTASTRPRSSRT